MRSMLLSVLIPLILALSLVLYEGSYSILMQATTHPRYSPKGNAKKRNTMALNALRSKFT